MNDRANERRSLELVALATDKNMKNYEWYVSDHNDREYGYFCAAGDGSHIWNPRRRLDDALHVAVQLNFTVEICGTDGYTAVRWAGDELSRVKHGATYEDGPDMATCVAIVDAAACVGALCAGYVGEDTQ